MKKVWFILAIFVLTLRLPGQTTKPVRVALMDFISEDHSYRSTVAVADIMSALQAKIPADKNYDWVERAELEKAANEMKIAGLGLIDRSEAIQGGRWVKADWGIFGTISTNFNGQRTLSLEIVDLKRADVLAETNWSLLPDDSEHFQMKSVKLPDLAANLTGLLNQAHEIYLDSEKQDAVAFLFLSMPTTDGGPGEPLGGLRADFRRFLFTESTNSRQFHVVQLQRADAAMDEANLVLSGLAENDSNAWDTVADQYVWGDATVNDTADFDWGKNAWQNQQKIEVHLNVWDGRSEPHAIILTTTNETSAAVAMKLIQAVKPLLRQDRTKPVVENVRQRISRSLFARYSEQPADAVQLLETACFFDPGNAAAREQLIRLRWGTIRPGYDFDDYIFSMAGNNAFSLARRLNEEWGKYVDQFGFKSALTKPNSPSIATEYVLSARMALVAFNYSQENQAQWGVPRDAGLSEVTEWQNQFGLEFVSRLLEVADSPELAPRSVEFFHNALSIPDLQARKRMVEQYWPRILEQAKKAPIGWSDPYLLIRKYFEDMGQPDGEQKFLAQLDSANQEGTKNQAATAPPPPPVQLLRLQDLKSTPTQIPPP